ncbi:MAG: hypothetical protein M1829_006454 [Trizodia sp. TS-e1964]|nr:MAG: hypothetical protein M1829_006454 [Trizodia sp. TS-e1964]
MSTEPSASDCAPKMLKILMLHGYTQSGPSFRNKTRAHEKALMKALPPGTLPSYPGGLQLVYPTGPLRVLPGNFPPFAHHATDGMREEDVGKEGQVAEELDAWGWWRREETDPTAGLDGSLEIIADVLRKEGTFAGAIGFSQGAALAAMVASLLEPIRTKSFGEAFPKSFLRDAGQVIHEPFKFVVAYAGFVPSDVEKNPYYTPKISTRIQHVYGGNDTVVNEERFFGLVGACENGRENVIYHPGGHFMPSQKLSLDVLVSFVRHCCTGQHETMET